MSFWTWIKGTAADETANSNVPPGTPPTVGPPDYTGGDPDGFEVEGDRPMFRSLPQIQPSGWDGWPEAWGVPNWDFQSRFNELVDSTAPAFAHLAKENA